MNQAPIRAAYSNYTNRKGGYVAYCMGCQETYLERNTISVLANYNSNVNLTVNLCELCTVNKYFR